MIERKILIGLITSTEFCQKIKDIWDLQLIESTTAKRLASWIWEYYAKYGKAPGKEIETIYYSKIKGGKLAADVAEEIEQEILPGLSKEYENNSFNLEYLLSETEKYFNERHLTIHKENIESLLAAGQVEEAEKMAKEFKPLGTSTGKLDEFILTANQIRNKGKEHSTVLMKPWLKEGQTTIIYGTFGSGKSLLAISVAYVLGVRNYEDKKCDIVEWQVKHPTGCLYIDGELGEQEMEERIKQFEWLGKQPPEYKLRILSVPEYQLATEDSFYLSDRENQRKIIQWLKDHPTYKLVILDSASTLFGLLEENSNSEWNNKISPFLRDLRALSVACILLHHAGKDGKKGLRGASAMGAMAHNIFKLTNHEGKVIEEGKAWFVLDKDKQRASGYSFKKFALQYTQDLNKTETHWKKTGIDLNN